MMMIIGDNDNHDKNNEMLTEVMKGSYEKQKSKGNLLVKWQDEKQERE